MDDDVDQADAVAFVLAHVRGDEPLVHELLAMHDGPGLFGSVVGLLMRLLNHAGVGEAAVEAALVEWQEQRRAKLGLPLRRVRGVPADGVRSCRWQDMAGR